MRKPLARSSSGKRPSRRRLAIEIIPVPGLPEIRGGADLARLIVIAARRAKIAFQTGDVVVVAQKIISKAERCLVRLSAINPSPQALEFAATRERDPRLVEVILRESKRIVRREPVLIVETRHGFICANAGVDQSNVPGRDVVTLLPRDPDGSARSLAVALQKRSGARVAVIISDTFGRPWRLGLTNVAIGAAGVPVLLDLRGRPDRGGKTLHATILAVADELASAAGLVMRKMDGIPVVIIRGYRYSAVIEPASRIIRPADQDLFR